MFLNIRHVQTTFPTSRLCHRALLQVRRMWPFLLEHLLMDMRVLGKALSAVEDEVAMYLDQIIVRISTKQDVTDICVCSCASMQVTLTTIEGLAHNLFKSGLGLFSLRSFSGRKCAAMSVLTLPINICQCIRAQIFSYTVSSN